MPIDPPIPLADRSPVELDTMRRTIVAKANGNHEALDDADLFLLVDILAILRRRSVGPPKEAKPIKVPKGKKETADSLLDLL